MAKQVIPKGKRRYTLSLTEKNVDKFRALVKEIGLTRNFMSLYVDADIELGINVMEKIKEQQKDIGSKVDMESIIRSALKEQKQLKLF